MSLGTDCAPLRQQGRTEQTALPEQAAWSDYQDAMLLNALGIRIGEVALRKPSWCSMAAKMCLASAMSVERNGPCPSTI